MKITDIIRKKKQGEELSFAEIKFFTDGYTKGDIPDYQISPLLMAIYFKGMNGREIADLTRAFVESGDVIDLADIPGIKVDKHSTGGVGDKISLIVLPIAASLGIPVAKLSGKGLGHTGGTIDKLEAIPGFTTQLSLAEFKGLVLQTGVALAGQTGNLTPADKKFYALRDVTETVDSIPLIASSIMSKKIASGSDAIVLDVKTGEGAFMKTLEDSIQLAKTMVEIGKSLGRNTIAVLTDMNEPLGREIGNANEVIEAMAVLKGERIPGLWDVALEIASYMVFLGKKADSPEHAKALIEAKISSGEALAMFRTFIKNQGGDPRITEDYSLLPQAGRRTEIIAEQGGYVTGINASDIGYAAMYLGAGRQKKDDRLDYSAGIRLEKFVGDRVQPGEVLCILKHNKEDVADSIQLAQSAFQIGPVKTGGEKHILAVIR